MLINAQNVFTVFSIGLIDLIKLCYFFFVSHMADIVLLYSMADIVVLYTNPTQ